MPEGLYIHYGHRDIIEHCTRERIKRTNINVDTITVRVLLWTNLGSMRLDNLIIDVVHMGGGKMLQKKCKRHIMYVDLLMIVLMLCGCGDKITRGTSLRQEISDGNQVAIEDKKNENEDDLQELKYTEQPEITSPTPCPDVPPYYVMLGGALMQIKEDVPGDLSEYQVEKSFHFMGYLQGLQFMRSKICFFPQYSNRNRQQKLRYPAIPTMPT